MNEKPLSIFIEEPTECPTCLFKLTKINDQLFCKNVECDAQVNKKLEHFCKTLGIKGLGPKTIEKLMLRDLSEIFYLDLQESTEILGSKVALKLQDEINRARSANLQTVLASLSIPLIGTTAAEKLCTVVASIEEINKETCKQAGLGEKATSNLLEWLDTDGKDIIPFLPFTFKTEGVLSGNYKTVCITGKLKSFKKKADAEQLLKEAGYKLVDNLSKSTSYLVDENDSQSAKRVSAEKFGIQIITDLNDLLKVKIK